MKKNKANKKVVTVFTSFHTFCYTAPITAFVLVTYEARSLLGKYYRLRLSRIDG